MTTVQIIEKANEVIRNASYTKIVKAGKNAGACFLIVNTGEGLALYGSYSSKAVYGQYNGQSFRFA